MAYFDIVIPTYNRASLIRRAIDSVLTQNFKSWQLYIIDNCSEDNTEHIVKNIRNEQITYLKNDTNIGMMRNWHKALHTGISEYVVFLGDDDELLPNFLSDANKVLNENKDVFLYSTAVLINNNGKKYEWVPKGLENESKGRILINNPGDRFYLWMEGNPISPASVVIKRSALKYIADCGFLFPYPWTVDKYWWAQIALNGKWIYNLTPLAIYYQHAASESNKGKYKTRKLRNSLVKETNTDIIKHALNLGVLNRSLIIENINKLQLFERIQIIEGLIYSKNKLLKNIGKHSIRNIRKDNSMCKTKYYFLRIFKLLGVRILKKLRNIKYLINNGQ